MSEEKRQLQSVILIIADEIKRICDKYEIPYFIEGGTALGAIRHKGFVPWDDDLDLAMRREDFERFLRVCRKELDPEKFFLQSGETEKSYPFAFCKVQLCNTKYTEDFSRNAPVQHGIFVDIFPYDAIPEAAIPKVIFKFRNRLLKNILWVKCGYGTDGHKKSASYLIYKILGIPFSISWLKKRRKKLITSYNNKGSNICFTADYPGTILPIKWFDQSQEYLFENRFYTGFREIDSFLHLLFGDYMVPPPESEREVHSQYEIDFGPYKN